MVTWIVKSETDDSERALEIVADQRIKGYTAWIEDERGKAVDEESLRKNEAVPSKPSVREHFLPSTFYRLEPICMDRPCVASPM